MKKRLIQGVAVVVLVFVSGYVSGQVEYRNDTTDLPGWITPFDDQIEKNVEILEIDHDVASLAEDLVDLAANPVNINNASADDLNAIPFLTQDQRSNLYNYLVTYGEVLSIYELQSVKGFDSVLIQRILPFMRISPPVRVPSLTLRNLARFSHHDLLLRYEEAFPKATGYLVSDSLRANGPGSYYPGSPQRYYFRYNFSWFDRIRIGFAGEKDPGEQFFRGNQKNGMDFYAAYLYISNIGILKNLTIGNFKVSYGLGLIMGSGLSLGSVPGFSSGIPMSNGIRPSLGMSEGSYLRGLAVTLKIKRVEISGFGSLHPRDATITRSDSISELEEITSFSGTGYHRTRLELEKRNAITELLCGGNINFSMAPTQQLGFRIGLSGIFSKYAAPVIQEILPYNQFEFRGNQNLNTGLDFQVRYHGMHLFGEIGRSLNSGMSWLSGISLVPDPRVSMTFIYRNYQPAYQDLYSNAFGQNSANANERGIYAAVNAAVHPRVTLSGYMDLFAFPWLKYRVDGPARGHEAGISLGWKAGGKVMVTMRYYRKNTMINGNPVSEQAVHRLVGFSTSNFRMDVEWLPGNGIMLKTRIEAKKSGESELKNPYGYLIYQEMQVRSKKWPESITLRFALFDVPGYAARIYVYEPEVLYGYSVPAFEGKGMRTCMVLKFGIVKRVDLSLRGGITYYTDRDEIGTGLDLTKGSIRGELTGQLLVKL